MTIGLGATPMLYYAEASSEDVDGGIQITGSHNPANYNGFKMVFQGRPFFGADIQKLGEMAATGDWDEGAGSVESREILSEYVERLLMGLGDVDRAVEFLLLARKSDDAFALAGESGAPCHCLRAADAWKAPEAVAAPAEPAAAVAFAVV